jgi:hypothetical protein
LVKKQAKGKRRTEGGELRHPPAVIAPYPVERAILLVRGHRVMLDLELAALYGVPTKALNQAVRRNRERFPEDFMLQLTAEEKQEVVTNCDHLSRLKYSSVRPYAFTEHGAIMAASVLNSQRAVEASVYVVRAFVRMRGMLAANRELAARLEELDRRVGEHDEAIRQLVAAIRELMEPPEEPLKGRIGFQPKRT